MHIESVSASFNLIRDYGYFQDSCGTQFLAFDDSGNTSVQVFPTFEHSRIFFVNRVFDEFQEFIEHPIDMWPFQTSVFTNPYEL